MDIIMVRAFNHIGPEQAPLFVVSDYFDNDSSNDHNLIHGFTFSYAPSFLPGFTVGLNRTCLVKSSKEKQKRYSSPDCR